MKSSPIWKMVAVVVLVLVALGAVLMLERTPGTVAGLRTPTPRPFVSASPSDPLPSSFSLGTVAVQTFLGPTLVRSGAGTVVSSDGLILTSSAVAPYGSGSYVYQVATATGSLLRAAAVWRDGAGLMLLKVSATDLDAVSFDEQASVQAGTAVRLISARMALSRYVSVMMTGTIPYVSGDARDIPLSTDRAFGPVLAGARAVNDAGGGIGMVRFAGASSYIVPASVLNGFIENYLTHVVSR